MYPQSWKYFLSNDNSYTVLESRVRLAAKVVRHLFQLNNDNGKKFYIRIKDDSTYLAGYVKSADRKDTVKS